MATPNVQAPEWAAAQATPWVEHNKALRIFDAFAAVSIIEDRDLNSPPGACADGARYLVATGGSGLWLARDGQLAIAVGANASNGWYFATVALEGMELWVRDENIKLRHTGAGWGQLSDSVDRLAELLDIDMTGLADGFTLKWDQSNGIWYPAPDVGQSGLVAVEISASSYSLEAEHVGRYLRLTNPGTKLIDVRANATHALPANGEWHIRNAGLGDATLVEAVGVDIIPPADGSLIIPYGGTVTLKRFQSDNFDLLGVTSPLTSG